MFHVARNNPPLRAAEKIELTSIGMNFSDKTLRPQRLLATVAKAMVAEGVPFFDNRSQAKVMRLTINNLSFLKTNSPPNLAATAA